MKIFIALVLLTVISISNVFAAGPEIDTYEKLSLVGFVVIFCVASAVFIGGLASVYGLFDFLFQHEEES